MDDLHGHHHTPHKLAATLVDRGEGVLFVMNCPLDPHNYYLKGRDVKEKPRESKTISLLSELTVVLAPPEWGRAS